MPAYAALARGGLREPGCGSGGIQAARAGFDSPTVAPVTEYLMPTRSPELEAIAIRAQREARESSKALVVAFALAALIWAFAGTVLLRAL